MALTILSDTDVRTILHSLTKDEVERLQRSLAEALHDYSTGTQETTSACSANQPQRAQIKTKETTTLFMPARSSTTSGVKIVTLQTSEAKGPPSISSKSATSGRASPSPTTSSGRIPSYPRTSSPRPSLGSLSLKDTSSISSSTASLSTAATERSSSSSAARGGSSAPTTPTGSTLLPEAAEPAAGSAVRATMPQGTLTLLTASGAPLALINAAELTAFRTALAATLLLKKRTRLHSIAVFGAGKQAYWHIRLALLLRGADIHHVRIVNRSFAGAGPLLQTIYTAPEWAALRASNSKLDFSVLSAEYGEYPRLLKEHVRDADAIFCCTPATAPLFPAEFLTSSEGRRKGRYLSLIGSYQPHMTEVHPDILRQAVVPEHGKHHHKHAERGGVVVVDSLEACLHEAGEVIQAGIKPDELVEIGELIMVKRAAMREVEMGQAGEPGLQRWLESGDVIYKSVGFGLMDLSVGAELVALATEKGIGTRVEDF